MRTAILDAVKQAGTEGIAFSDLSAAVSERLSDAQRETLGSIGWHTTVVKLNMEVEREITRVPKITPQRIILI